jgi:hypothetical protein
MPEGILLKILADRSRFKTPLEIELDESRCIRACNYTFDGDYSFGSTIHHEGQAIDRGMSWPTEREYYGIELPNGGNATYEELKSLVVDAKHDDPDDLPWIRYDQYGAAVAESETKEALMEWLHRLVQDERLENWGDSRISEYGIGIESSTHCPTRSVPASGWFWGTLAFLQVSYRPSWRALETFNLLMEQKGLPVVLRG